MKMLFRWAFRLFIAVVVLVVAGILLLDTIAKEMVETRIRTQTGMDVSIGDVYIGLLSPVITVDNFKLYNTAEFGGSPLVDMPELHIEYDRRALFSRKLHCTLMRLNLAEVNLVQSKNGKMNIDLLRPRPHNQQHPGAAGGPAAPTRRFEFNGIDTLNLTLGKATLVKMNAPSQVQEMKLNVHNLIIPDVRTAQDLQMRLLLILAQNGGGNWLNLIPRN